jgi:hypothetical protein
VFFGLAALNLPVDSPMFEKRFLMLAERLALGIPFLFFFGTTNREKLFFAVFSVFSLKQSAFQRTMVCHTGFVLL